MASVTLNFVNSRNPVEATPEPKSYAFAVVIDVAYLSCSLSKKWEPHKRKTELRIALLEFL